MPPIYGTPTEFWQFVGNRRSLFQDEDFRPGAISSVLKVGTGTGSVKLGPKSNPLDSFSVVVECVVGGRVNETGVVSAGPLPQFRISDNAGVAFFKTVEVSPDENVATITLYELGVTLEVRNGLTEPSFVAGDLYSFTTTASPDLLSILESNSRFMDGYFVGSTRVPLAGYDAGISKVLMALAFWDAIKRKGISPNQDFKIYEPKMEMNWLMAVRDGHVRPGAVETPPGVYFADIAPVIPSVDDLQYYERVYTFPWYFPI